MVGPADFIDPVGDVAAGGEGVRVVRARDPLLVYEQRSVLRCVGVVRTADSPPRRAMLARVRKTCT